MTGVGIAWCWDDVWEIPSALDFTCSCFLLLRTELGVTWLFSITA